MARLCPLAGKVLHRGITPAYRNHLYTSSHYTVATQAFKTLSSTFNPRPRSLLRSPKAGAETPCWYATSMRPPTMYRSPFSVGLRFGHNPIYIRLPRSHSNVNCVAGPLRAFSSGASNLGGGLVQAVGQVAVFCATLYVGLCALLYLFQRKLLYFPTTSPAPPADTLQTYLPELEDFTTLTEDGVRIQGYYWPPPPSAAANPVAILVLHGNAGSRVHRLELMQLLRSRLGVGVCVPDYRGFGGSEGSPTEEGLIMDASAATAWLTRRIPPGTQIVLLGKSIGAAVALGLLEQSPQVKTTQESSQPLPTALILQSAFSSAVAVGEVTYPYFPVRLLMKDRFDNLGRAAALPPALPVCCVHGARDEICPAQMGRALYEVVPSKRKLWRCIPGAGHNDLPYQFSDAYVAVLEELLAQLRQPAPPAPGART